MKIFKKQKFSELWDIATANNTENNQPHNNEN